MTKITRRTWVPMGMLGSVGLVVIGFSFWLTNMYNQGNANAAAISEVKQTHEIDYRTISQKLDGLIVDVAEIKGTLRQMRREKEK